MIRLLFVVYIVFHTVHVLADDKAVDPADEILSRHIRAEKNPKPGKIKPPKKQPRSNFKPAVPLKQANKEFLECCQQLKMKPSCFPICNYRVDSFKLAATLFVTNCGIMTVNSWLACANGGERGGNNTECCQSHGVLNGMGKICRSFCEQYPTVKPDKGALVCGARIKSILKCHYAGLKPKPKDGQMFDNDKDGQSSEKI